MSSKAIIGLGVLATFSIILVVALSVGYGTNQYLFQDGSKPLTANWNAGNFNITASYLDLTGGIIHFSLGAMNEVTISNGIITVIGSNNVVDTESDDALDNLDHIDFTGVVDGTIISLRSANSGRDIDIRDVIVVGAGGNLQLVGNTAFRLTHPRDRMMLMFHSAENIWVELLRSDIA